MKRFEAHDVAMEAIKALQGLIVKIRASDAGLADQLKRAATSMVLNLGEGSRRQGRDRIQHFRIASGSAAESADALDVAVAWGYLEPDDAATPRGLLDRVLAMTWRLTHPRA